MVAILTVVTLLFLWLVKHQLPPAAFIFCSLFAIKNPVWTHSYEHSCSWEIRFCVCALLINLLCTLKLWFVVMSNMQSPTIQLKQKKERIIIL